MAKTYVRTLTIGPDDTEVTVEFSVSWGRPAQTSGPPEACYEAEPDEIELISVDPEPFWAEEELICEMLQDHLHDYVEEDDFPDPSDVEEMKYYPENLL